MEMKRRLVSLVTRSSRGMNIDLRWQQQAGKRNEQNILTRVLARLIPTQRVGPWHANIVNLDTTRLCQAQSNVVPIVGKLNTGLLSRNQRKDVTLGPFENTLQDGEIGYHAAGIEVLGTIEYEMVTVGCNLEIIVARVHSTTDKVVVRDDQLMGSLYLFGSSDDVCSGRPKEMVTQQHTNRSVDYDDVNVCFNCKVAACSRYDFHLPIRFRNLTNSLIPNTPWLLSTAILLRSKQLQQARVLE